MSIADERAREKRLLAANMQRDQRWDDLPPERRSVWSGQELDTATIDDIIQRQPRRSRPWPGVLAVVVVLLLVGALVVLSACGPAEQSAPQPPPLMLITIDAVITHDEGLYRVEAHDDYGPMTMLVAPTELGQGSPVPGLAVASREVLSQMGQGWRMVHPPRR